MIVDQKHRMKSRGICVIVPTYNNAGTIVDVVSRCLAQCDDVIVVCDGCTDNTVQLLEAMDVPPVILDLGHNRGKGIALREGFRYALKSGFAYAITLDGDGQHFPEDIPVLVEANIKHPGALIVGARKNLENAERSGGSKFANKFSNFWFAVQTGHYLPDTQTGYRLYPLKKLRALSLTTSRYEAELEFMVFASWTGVKLVSVPVNVYYPPAGERVTHFRPGPDFLRITMLNSVLCFLAVVWGYPAMLFRALMTFLRTLYALLFFSINTLCLMTPIAFFYMTFAKDGEKKKLNLHRGLNFMARFLLYTHKIPGVKFTEENPSGEDFSKPAVIICNHSSHLDLVPLLARTPKLIVLTADWVWKNPFYSYAIHQAEFLPASAGMDSIMPKLRNLVERGYSIALYPEGTRSLDCSIGRFHQGAFYIVEQLGVDLLPLYLYGAGKALPKHGRKLKRWPMHLKIGTRMTPKDVAALGEGTMEQAKAMRRRYIEEYNLLADRIEQNV